MRRERAISSLLFLGTLVVYSRVAFNEFSNFDDPDYITRNPIVLHGLSLAGFKWAFTTGHAGNWHPLTWLSLMLDCQLFGKHAGLHHLENVLWHAANAVLLFGFLRRSTGAVWRSAMVAALFAWHPLHVESVAWAAERKDVLSTFFGLLALRAYLVYVERPAIRRYAWMAVFFILSLLAKPMLVTFPFLLLLLDYWPLGRIGRYGAQGAESEKKNARMAPGISFARAILEKSPLFLLSAGISVVTFLAQKKGGAVVNMETFPPLTRATIAVISYVSYIIKMIWPRHLAVFYPCPPELPLNDAIAPTAGLLIITGAVIWWMRKRPYLFTGWFWYMGTLVPVIGFVQVGGQMMADRYTYIPMIGIWLVMVWGGADILGRWQFGKTMAVAGCTAALAACLGLTWMQIGYWKNSITLFEHSLAISPCSPLSHYDLAHAYSMRSDFSNAIPHYEEAIRLNPKYAEAYANLGTCYNLQGDFAEAIKDYRKALSLKEGSEQTHYGLATALAQQGDLHEARDHFIEALRLKPDFLEAQVKLGSLLMKEGRTDDAISHYQSALEIDPDNFEAHYCLAGALARQKKFPQAIASYQAAVKLNKDNFSALNDLAWILATEEGPGIHDPAMAIQLAQRACELTKFQDPGYLDTLAAAYSEAGRFPEAVEMIQKAVTAARREGRQPLVETIQGRMRFYQQHISYRAMVKSLAASPAKF